MLTDYVGKCVLKREPLLTSNSSRAFERNLLIYPDIHTIVNLVLGILSPVLNTCSDRSSGRMTLALKSSFDWGGILKMGEWISASTRKNNDFSRILSA
jgi:hypothetical protein